MRNHELITSILEFQAAMGIRLQFSSLHKWRSTVSSTGNGHFPDKSIKNYKAFWSLSQMDMRTSRTSFSPLYTAEGRKLKSFFMRYWLHPHIKAATVITESASISVRNPIWGGFREYWLLSIHKELILKPGSQLPWTHLICISHIVRAKPFLAPLTVSNFTDVIIKK